MKRHQAFTIPLKGMKRYLIFAGYKGEPHAGWGDFRASTNSRQKAFKILAQRQAHPDCVYAQIVDTNLYFKNRTGYVIYEEQQSAENPCTPSNPG